MTFVDDAKYQVQSNEVNYNHLNAELERKKSSCTPSVDTKQKKVVRRKVCEEAGGLCSQRRLHGIVLWLDYGGACRSALLEVRSVRKWRVAGDQV